MLRVSDRSSWDCLSSYNLIRHNSSCGGSGHLYPSSRATLIVVVVVKAAKVGLLCSSVSNYINSSSES